MFYKLLPTEQYEQIERVTKLHDKLLFFVFSLRKNYNFFNILN